MNCSALRYNISIKQYKWLKEVFIDINNKKYWKQVVNNGFDVIFIEKSKILDTIEYEVYMGFSVAHQLRRVCNIYEKDEVELRKKYDDPDALYQSFSENIEQTAREIINTGFVIDPGRKSIEPARKIIERIIPPGSYELEEDNEINNSDMFNGFLKHLTPNDFVVSIYPSFDDFKGYVEYRNSVMTLQFNYDWWNSCYEEPEKE